MIYWMPNTYKSFDSRRGRPRTMKRLSLETLMFKNPTNKPKSLYRKFMFETKGCFSNLSTRLTRKRSYESFRRMYYRIRDWFYMIPRSYLCHSPKLLDIRNKHFSHVRGKISEVIDLGCMLKVLVEFRDVVSKERWTFEYDFDYGVHSASSGEHRKVKHFSFNLPWSWLDFARACRITLPSIKYWDMKKQKYRFRPRFVIFDRSEKHGRIEHIEFDSLRTFLDVFYWVIRGYIGVALWTKFGQFEINTFHGRGHKKIMLGR